MDSSDVKPEQAEQLKATIRRQLRYLNRLCARMQAMGFPPADQLFQAAQRARCAVQDLHVAAHYVACKEGVG